MLGSPCRGPPICNRKFSLKIWEVPEEYVAGLAENSVVESLV